MELGTWCWPRVVLVEKRPLTECERSSMNRAARSVGARRVRRLARNNWIWRLSDDARPRGQCGIQRSTRIASARTGGCTFVTSVDVTHPPPPRRDPHVHRPAIVLRPPTTPLGVALACSTRQRHTRETAHLHPVAPSQIAELRPRQHLMPLRADEVPGSRYRGRQHTPRPRPSQQIQSPPAIAHPRPLVKCPKPAANRHSRQRSTGPHIPQVLCHHPCMAPAEASTPVSPRGHACCPMAEVDSELEQDPRGRAGSSREHEYPEARRSSLFVTRQRYPEA